MVVGVKKAGVERLHRLAEGCFRGGLLRRLRHSGKGQSKGNGQHEGEQEVSPQVQQLLQFRGGCHDLLYGSGGGYVPCRLTLAARGG